MDNSDSIAEVDYQKLIHAIEKYGIQGNKERFNHFIKLLVKISNNHYRQSCFFSKIEQIPVKYIDAIKRNNTSTEIYYLFRSNRQLLYFLIKEKIITIDVISNQLSGLKLFYF